jgi:hypothetical protein
LPPIPANVCHNPNKHVSASQSDSKARTASASPAVLSLQMPAAKCWAIVACPLTQQRVGHSHLMPLACSQMLPMAQHKSAHSAHRRTPHPLVVQRHCVHTAPHCPCRHRPACLPPTDSSTCVRQICRLLVAQQRRVSVATASRTLCPGRRVRTSRATYGHTWTSMSHLAAAAALCRDNLSHSLCRQAPAPKHATHRRMYMCVPHLAAAAVQRRCAVTAPRTPCAGRHSRHCRLGLGSSPRTSPCSLSRTGPLRAMGQGHRVC